VVRRVHDEVRFGAQRSVTAFSLARLKKLYREYPDLVSKYLCIISLLQF
jgi:hypothetical protein